MSVRSLLQLNEGNKIHLGSFKAIFVQVSQNFIKSHLKFCLNSQISAHSLWHVCITFDIFDGAEPVRLLKNFPALLKQYTFHPFLFLSVIAEHQQMLTFQVSEIQRSTIEILNGWMTCNFLFNSISVIQKF